MASFKNPSGLFYLRGLFFETQGADKSTVIYTLKDEEHEGYPSLYQLYMEENDLTEYEFAFKHLGGWEHWTGLCKCTWFKPIVRRWREELRLQNKASALRRIITESRSSSKNAFTANRFLVSGGWIEDEEKKTRGRPSKAELEAEKKRILNEVEDLDELGQRLQIIK